jgi:hypothetical protein
MSEEEKIEAGLSGVQVHDILVGETAPNACCPAPTLLCGPNPIWTLAGNRWVLTPFGRAVRTILERNDHEQ